MSKCLEGKVAIVTGAGGGIGREHAGQDVHERGLARPVGTEKFYYLDLK